MIDVHMHLPDEGPVDIKQLFREAREAGMKGFVLAGTGLEDSIQYADVAEQEDGVYSTVGVHPHESLKFRPEQMEKIRELVKRPRVVAVGEIGCDFYYDIAPEEAQTAVLVEMLRLANESGKPIVLHCREGFRQCYSLVKEHYDCSRPILVHSFTGTLEEQDAWLELGAYMSFNGMVTFKKADNVRQILSRMPKDRILLETDSPWLAPEPHRGRSNSPKYVPIIAERIGFELGMTREEVDRITTENARRMFGL